MPFYQRVGQVPPKRHTQFRKPDGELYREQVMGTKGFSGMQSILYHVYPPTQVREVTKIRDWEIPLSDVGANRHRHFFTSEISKPGDMIEGRQYWLANQDVTMATVTPTEEMKYFFRNSDGDELHFVHEGHGVLETVFGEIPYKEGDYLVIPVGTTYRYRLESEDSRFLVLETTGELNTPKRYRNEFGQLMEHSPFCERDFRVPQDVQPIMEEGDFEVRVKARGQLQAYLYDFHPLDVVGWDGYLYPYAFSIYDFEPITGSIHQPPPVHQTFQGNNFVVCSFVPRMYDYHPLAIPAPYYHSNVNSDEVLYYVKGNFMSRKGIRQASLTLHPSGIPHGPHPGKVEASLGKTRTEELAVMVDTFQPLFVTKEALAVEDPGYMYTWNPNKGESPS